MNPRYPQVAERAAHRCEYCQAPEAVFNFPFEVEHIVPPVHGGVNASVNLALACRACNLHKAAHLEALDPLTGEPAKLFHPRHDTWPEHFEVGAGTGELQGRTAIGPGHGSQAANE